MNNAFIWDVMPGGFCKNRRFGEMFASIKLMRISELGSNLAVTSKRYRRFWSLFFPP
jgi:hypothetical protein